MNKIIISVGIFAETIKKANAFLESYVNQCVVDENIERYVFSKSGSSLQLKDGLYIRCFTYDEKSRGHKFDKVFIGTDVPEQFLNERIRPAVGLREIIYTEELN